MRNLSLICFLASLTAAPLSRADTPPGGNPWVTPAVTATGVQQRIFSSTAARTEVSYHVYLPPAYGTESERRFPVLYWLHGSGGGLKGIAAVSAHFERAIRAGKIPPLLVVFPNGHSESMWCDSHDGRAPMETVVIRELIPDVDAHFRTIADRTGRIVEGFSMGGYGAARLGLKHPQLFGAVSLLGAGPLQREFDPDTAPRSDPAHARALFAAIWGGKQSAFQALSPWKIAADFAASDPPPLFLRQIIGDRDGTLADNRRFHERLAHLKIPHAYRELPDVGHDVPAVFRALGEDNWAFYRAALR